MLTLKEWLNINPTEHKKTVMAAPGDRVRVLLHGGRGLDDRIAGEGDTEEQATENALSVRQQMAQVLG